MGVVSVTAMNENTHSHALVETMYAHTSISPSLLLTHLHVISSCSLQVVSLLQFPTLFPDSLNTYLSFYSLITDAIPFVSLDCSMPDYQRLSKATIRTLVNVLSLAYISAVCWIFWLARTVWLYLRARLVIHQLNI